MWILYSIKYARFELAVFQVLNNPMWLVATILDSIALYPLIFTSFLSNVCYDANEITYLKTFQNGIKMFKTAM